MERAFGYLGVWWFFVSLGCIGGLCVGLGAYLWVGEGAFCAVVWRRGW